MIKLWAHECTWVFHDWLISDEDWEKFIELLKEVLKEKFKWEWKSLVTVEPLLFSTFVPTVYPDDDETKKPLWNILCELTNRDKLIHTCNTFLGDYNQGFDHKKMDLVLFMDAIEHVVKIFRIITTPLGNAFLVGVGGSGRKSLTRLATHIADFECFSVEITKAYNVESWKDDMK